MMEWSDWQSGQMAEVEVQENAPREPAAIETADIVVGILSYNNAETIGSVVRAPQSGLSRYFPESRGILVHADGGSKDGTQSAALEAAPDRNSIMQVTYPVYPAHKLSSGYYPIPARGNAVRAVFEAAG